MPRASVVALLVLAVMASAPVGLAGRQGSAEVSPDTQTLLADGQYVQAEAAARREVERLAGATPADPLATARASGLLVSALLRNGKGAADATLALAWRNVRSNQAQPRTRSDDLARSLTNLSEALLIAGTYPTAISMARRAVAAVERAGIGDSRLADALDGLGSALTTAGRYPEALRVLKRSLAIREAAPDLGQAGARTLTRLARTMQASAYYDGAGPVIRRAQSVQEQTNREHPAYAEVLNIVGLQLWFEGQLAQARDVASAAIEVSERTLRPDHPITALALRYKAGALIDLGDLAQGQTLLERALGIAERTFGPTHLETWPYVNDLSMSELFQGRYTVARVLADRARTIAERRLGAWNDKVATTVGNLALIDARLGDYASARAECLRATAIWTRVLGADHAFVAQSLTDLAVVYREQGAPRDALPLVERALAIWERRLGPDHRSVATTLADLAELLRRLGRLPSAQRAAERAVRIWEKAGAPDAPEFAGVLKLYADLQGGHGNAALARDYYERALAIETKAMGGSHPMVADTQIGLATALANLGDRPAAMRTAIDAEAAGRSHLRLMLRSLPERQSLTYAAARPRGLDLAISLAGDSHEVQATFDAVVRSRALVLDELAARRRVSADALAPDAAKEWTALASARQRLANLVVRGPGGLIPQQYTNLVERALLEKEVAERALGNKSEAFRAERFHEEAGLEAVRQALPARSSLVAFIRFTHTVTAPASPVATTTPRRSVPSYAAFVLRGDRPDVAMIPLGDAAPIDRLVSLWRREATGILRTSSAVEAERLYRAAGTSLRRRIWDPVAAAIGSPSTVFVVPDGSLDMVSLTALPAGRSAYLIEQGPVIHYLSAERDLVTSPPSSRAARELLAVGGAAFNDGSMFERGTKRPLPKVAVVTEPPARTRGGCDDLSTLQFAPLSGTLAEIHDIGTQWTGRRPQILERQAATEGAFKRLAPGHRVLHLATHGFFLDAGCVPSAGPARDAGATASVSSRRPGPGTADNPLLLSGLALAGANRRAEAGPADEDGILTAEEVASLDLSSVEWAVLSACDTGLGVVKAGEGVFGLRRAFQVAGARTVIMSLWSVDDQATREWMHLLYQMRLGRRLTTVEAVNQASLSVLRARRAAGQSTHPFYWAGFVATGDWR